MRRLVLALIVLAAAMPIARASDATFHGSLGAVPLNQRIVGMAATPSGNGYWLVASDGGVFTFGDAQFKGSAGALPLVSPISGMAATPSGNGYWLVAEDGGVFTYGDAAFFGSVIDLGSPAVALVSTAAGDGFWLVGRRGHVLGLGGARTTGIGPVPRGDVVGAALAGDGDALWLVTASGAVDALGAAIHHGDLAGVKLNAPIVGIAGAPGGGGYWLVGSDGGIFSFGSAVFHGSTGAITLNKPIVGMASSPGQGYWFVASDGGIFTMSPASSPPDTCTILPADNPWNTDVSSYPVHTRSAAWVSSIGGGNLHPDFGTSWEGGPIGIPYVEVPAGQAGVPVTFDYDDESDHGLYPIPPDAPIEGGVSSDGDRHVLVLSRSECKLYELYTAFPQDGGSSWHAGSGAIFDLRSNALRPEGWTSADAAGLPILPGLVRYDEVAAGAINHALRFTISTSQRGYIHPATHFASSNTDPNVPPMGARFRMKPSYDCSGLSREIQVVCAALKRYGMFVADNGSSWYVSGSHDDRWDDDAVGDLKSIPGSAFEAIESGPVQN